MIHLEDYLDTLEALPMELQRQFTLMRELDALSQDIQEQMKQATEDFVENPPTKDDPRHVEYMKSFIQLFSTVLKHGEEKVALATQTYDLVDKHIRKLDDDLTKFEERQLTLPPRIPHSWGPSALTHGGSTALADGASHEDGGSAERDRRGRRAANANGADDSGAGGRKKRGNKDPSPTPANGKPGTPNIRRGGHGGGRGTGTAQGGGGSGSAGTATAALAAVVAAGGGGSKSSNGGYDGASKSRHSKAEVPDFAGMPIDPNEPRYCYCRHVSYGEMVACDDENCEIEWFHLGCVDLKSPPKGQWFCKDCSQKHKRRRDHHS